MDAISAAVLRRLAEAADGYRTGEPVWFVTSEENLRKVYPAPSQQEAESIARGLSPSHRVYGPFLTPPDRLPVRKVARIRLEYTDGTQREIDGSKVDALFLSHSAREKFVYPYYARVLGPEIAAQMKLEDQGGAPSHLPNSTMSNEDDGGNGGNGGKGGGTKHLPSSENIKVGNGDDNGGTHQPSSESAKVEH